MRKITLSLLALVMYATAYCGVPQAISYQAVALGSTGPIKLKTVGLRLSILYGTTTGPVSYQETQTPTTDNSGTFSIQIGNGSVVSGTFSGIDWSKGTYFLKTEIDTNGGSTYAAVGTVQFFSVPFALYSNATAQTNLGSPDYPDGINNIVPVSLSGSFAYNVPSGQTLYITQLSLDTSTSCSNYGISVNGVSIASNQSGASISSGGGAAPTGISTNKVNMSYPMSFPSGYFINSTSCGTAMLGFTIPTNNTCVVVDLSTGNYTVPNGKVLVIKNMIPSASSTWGNVFSIGSNTHTYSQNLNFVDQNQTVSAYGLTGSMLMMGYLKNR